ncbi:exonuclease, partial [Escherichia coli EC1850]
EVA